MKYSLLEIPNLCEKLKNKALESVSGEHATLITFSGDLGAGKTTFIKEFAKQFGVTEDLHSPTFVIYKKYPLENQAWGQFIHGDAYRIEDVSELGPLGWEALLSNPDNLICMEWPEKIAQKIPGWAIRVVITHLGGDSRDIQI